MCFPGAFTRNFRIVIKNLFAVDSHAITAAATKVSIDYQLIADPAYNTDRGSANVFAGRVHAQL